MSSADEVRAKAEARRAKLLQRGEDRLARIVLRPAERGGTAGGEAVAVDGAPPRAPVLPTPNLRTRASQRR